MVLLNAHRFERYGDSNVRIFPGFEIRYGAGRGVFLMAGNLKIHDAGKERYAGWLQGNVGSLGDIHREKFIYESESFFGEPGL